KYARLTGGRERLKPDEVWSRIPRKWNLLDTTPVLALLAILLLLAEVAQRRLHFFKTSPRTAAVSQVPTPAATSSLHTQSTKPQEITAKQESTSAVVPPVQTSPTSDALQEALRRARRK
ncbi:MAG: hypothetical protein IJJ26_02155, partial [Victivallales bacterium]|nr:hypothetical protein [Victivallales bacterium]